MLDERKQEVHFGCTSKCILLAVFNSLISALSSALHMPKVVTSRLNTTYNEENSDSDTSVPVLLFLLLTICQLSSERLSRFPP